MAEFSSVDTLLAACRRVRDAGYTKTDAYTPFPVHGIDEALGIKPTVLPFISLAGGLTGTSIALAMQIWMNAIDYPYIISGKPYISLPAFIPVTFELTILLASFGAFFGMLILNKLPRFSNPMFSNSRFDSATDDKFFLYIDSKDPRYEAQGVQKLMGDLGASSVDGVHEDESSDALPKPFLAIVASLALLSIVPALVVARMRVTTSTSPRFHVFYDMDFSPSKDAQETTTLFADGRTMRPDVRGTISRQASGYSADFYTGVDIEALTQLDPVRAERLVRFNRQPPAQDPVAEEATGEEPSLAAATELDGTAEPAPAAVDAAVKPVATEEVVDTTPWLKENPLAISRETLELGQKQYNIYCAVCHGQDGGGNGLVNTRAQQILAPNWVPPSSLHQAQLYDAVYADGKLFNTISNGIRKMPGYAGQITANDRWAVVAYVRALQLSRNASESDVPEADKNAIVAASTVVTE
jgi:mono/diheme cytochrome c family protein